MEENSKNEVIENEGKENEKVENSKENVELQTTENA